MYVQYPIIATPTQLYTSILEIDEIVSIIDSFIVHNVNKSDVHEAQVDPTQFWLHT